METEQSPSAPRPEAERPGDPAKRPPGADVLLKNPRSLERLRERIEEAVHALEHLRRENEALAARIRELETRPEVPEGAAVVAFEEDAEALKEKLAGFIAAVDQYLEQEAS